tara:strand:+ start:572 stop:928 length:357 start_codon:yes stop_codon:yes gene_type:complete
MQQSHPMSVFGSPSLPAPFLPHLTGVRIQPKKERRSRRSPLEAIGPVASDSTARASSEKQDPEAALARLARSVEALHGALESAARQLACDPQTAAVLALPVLAAHEIRRALRDLDPSA